jgi:hypothetical protein
MAVVFKFYIMSSDSVGSGETFDGDDSAPAPEYTEPAPAPEHFEPGDEQGDQDDTEVAGTRDNLDDFEPADADGYAEEPGHASEPVHFEPAEQARGNEVADEDVFDEADRVAGQARASAERQTEDIEDGDAGEGRDQGAAAETAGRMAAGSAVAGEETNDDVADSPGNGSEVDDVDEHIAEHDRDLETNGQADRPVPEPDLDELEALMALLDDHAGLVGSQRNLYEEDAGWENSRDAASTRGGDLDESPATDEDADGDPLEAGADNAIDPEFAASEWVDPAEAINNGAPRTNGQAVRTDPVTVMGPDIAADMYAQVTGEWTEAEAQDHDNGEHPDGNIWPDKIDYPPELIRATDALSQQGAAGEVAALMLLDEYAVTGRMPLTIPEPAEAPDDEADDNHHGNGQAPLF